LRDAGLITFEEKMVAYCYKELIFPAECSTSMTARGLHIWPQKAHFLMALVNKDGSFTGMNRVRCFLFLTFLLSFL
jgi:hypothetical protein